MTLIIPRNSIFRPVVNTFLATFNSPTPGKYDWGVAANVDQAVMTLAGHNLYYLALMNFSATVDEGSFLQNISTAPRVQFRSGQNKSALFGGSYPLAKYLINNSIGAFFSSPQKSDTLTATFTGVLNQDATLISFPTITAVLAMNVFEITDQDFISEYHGRKKAGEPMPSVVIPPEFDKRI